MASERKARVRGPGGTTREDWIRTALDTLVSEGVDQVKVLTLANKLGIARSSFYWYFKNRSELLECLLDHWADINTKAIVSAASSPADTITMSLAQLFSGWISGRTFDTALDFAIRDWSRRSGSVRRALDVSDNARIDAISAMFVRHGFESDEADVRARIVYFTQIGYATLDQREDWEARSARSRLYLFCHTGVEPEQAAIDLMEDAAINAAKRRQKVHH